ncbi:MAG: hypothetical protein H6983_06360 [Ectothiorhodospiraceae bacterium]|nr:hypothetical protein [Chromatiales bacterium]MCP5153768.1 hypothetical protein [Ectothiorhodospiraceae bacterium]
MKYDTPLEICPKCNELVALDQTQKECANEHGCKHARCPLDGAFSGHTFHEGAPASGAPAGKPRTRD